MNTQNSTRERVRNHTIWLAIPFLLLIAPGWWTETWGVLEFQLFYVPLAIWLGYAFSRDGIWPFAVGAVLLLPPGLSLGQLWIPSNAGLYVVAMVAYRAFSEPALFVEFTKRIRDTWMFYMVVFMILGLRFDWNESLGPIQIQISLIDCLLPLYFVLGMSKVSKFRAISALLIAIVLGHILREIQLLNPIGLSVLRVYSSYFVLGVLLLYIGGNFGRHVTEPKRDVIGHEKHLYIIILLSLVVFFTRFHVVVDIGSSNQEETQEIVIFGTRSFKWVLFALALTICARLGLKALIYTLIAGSILLLSSTTVSDSEFLNIEKMIIITPIWIGTSFSVNSTSIIAFIQMICFSVAGYIVNRELVNDKSINGDSVDQFVIYELRWLKKMIVGWILAIVIFVLLFVNSYTELLGMSELFF